VPTDLGRLTRSHPRPVLALTGLPNRVLALDRTEQMPSRGRRTQIPAAGLYIDIDGFKNVNDTLGHAAGDEFLTLVAERLLDLLREPYSMKDRSERQFSLTASIGIAYGQRTTAEEMLADADVALYRAKGDGKNRCALFEPGMHTAVQDRLTLEMDLSGALESDELFLVYQPTFDLQTGNTVGTEALIRWRHPVHGVIQPDAFIPIAEETGLDPRLSHWRSPRRH
jgi:predicted signal transduction protein with EAL and GGDEF domain